MQNFPNAFSWAGEINVFKHALAANGFFADPNNRVTVARINRGEYDAIFTKFVENGWPVTLHCDIGCDNYDAIPKTRENRNLVGQGCHVPTAELRLAAQPNENKVNWTVHDVYVNALRACNYFTWNQRLPNILLSLAEIVLT